MGSKSSREDNKLQKTSVYRPFGISRETPYSPWFRKMKQELVQERGFVEHCAHLIHLRFKQRIKVNLQESVSVLLMGECNEGENWVLKADREKRLREQATFV